MPDSSPRRKATRPEPTNRGPPNRAAMAAAKTTRSSERETRGLSPSSETIIRNVPRAKRADLATVEAALKYGACIASFGENRVEKSTMSTKRTTTQVGVRTIGPTRREIRLPTTGYVNRIRSKPIRIKITEPRERGATPPPRITPANKPSSAPEPQYTTLLGTSHITTNHPVMGLTKR